ncbi:hypothetical protein IWQ61_004858 [Dispira simplex]|nr:hypothetical protein IWQ61_004858 [Dispira simplex]
MTPVENQAYTVSIRIYVEDARRYHSILCTVNSTAGSVIADMQQQSLLPHSADNSREGNWAFFELINDFGIERPLVAWEKLTAVIASWESSPRNSIVARWYPLQRYVTVMHGLPAAPPEHDGILHVQMKKQKWQKEHFFLRDGTLFYYKDSKRKVEIPYTTLEHMQIYTPSRPPRRTPTKYTLALKNESSITLFEKPEYDYVRLISVPDLESLTAWMIALRLAKNYLMFASLDEREQMALRGISPSPSRGPCEEPGSTAEISKQPSRQNMSSDKQTTVQKSLPSRKPAATLLDQLASGQIKPREVKETSGVDDLGGDHSGEGPKESTNAHMTAADVTRAVLSSQRTVRRASPEKSNPNREGPPDFECESFKAGSLLSYNFQKIAETHKDIRKAQEEMFDPNQAKTLPSHIENEKVFISGSLLAKASSHPVESAVPVPVRTEGSGPLLGSAFTSRIGGATAAGTTEPLQSNKGPLMSLNSGAPQSQSEDRLFKPGSLLTRAKSQHSRQPDLRGDRAPGDLPTGQLQYSKSVYSTKQHKTVSVGVGNSSTMNQRTPSQPLIQLSASTTGVISSNDVAFTPHSLLSRAQSRGHVRPSQISSSDDDGDDDDEPLIKSVSSTAIAMDVRSRQPHHRPARSSTHSSTDGGSEGRFSVELNSSCSRTNTSYSNRSTSERGHSVRSASRASSVASSVMSTPSDISVERHWPASRSSSRPLVNFNKSNAVLSDGLLAKADAGSRNHRTLSGRTPHYPNQGCGAPVLSSSSSVHRAPMNTATSHRVPNSSDEDREEEDDLPLGALQGKYQVQRSKSARHPGSTHSSRVMHTNQQHSGSHEVSRGYSGSTSGQHNKAIPTCSRSRSHSQSATHSFTRSSSRSLSRDHHSTEQRPSAPVPELPILSRTAAPSTKKPLVTLDLTREGSHAHQLKTSNFKPLISFDK